MRWMHPLAVHLHSPKAGFPASYHLIYKAKFVYLSVCVFRIRARVTCSVTLKLAVVAGGTGVQVIAGLTVPVLQFAESYSSISAFSFAGGRHFLIIVPDDFRFLPDLISCRPTFKFKPIIITPAIILFLASCSSNMVAEGIGGQASGAVARRRQATLLVLYNIQIATIR